MNQKNFFLYPGFGDPLPTGGRDVHLLTIGGTCVRGQWADDGRFLAWADMPKRDKAKEAALGILNEAPEAVGAAASGMTPDVVFELQAVLQQGMSKSGWKGLELVLPPQEASDLLTWITHARLVLATVERERRLRAEAELARQREDELVGREIRLAEQGAV